MFEYVAGHPVKLSLGLVAIVLSTAVGLMSPLLIGSAVDTLVDGFDRKAILTYAGLLIGVTLVQGIFSFVQRRILVAMSRDVEFEIRNDYFSALARQAQRFFHDSYTGDLMARATNDLAAVRMVCGPAIMYSTSTIFTALGAGFFMFRIHSGLAWWALSPLPLVALATRIIGRRIHDLFEKVQEQFAVVSTRVQENLSGVRVLRAYAREESELRAFTLINDEYLRRQRRLIRWNSTFHPALQMLAGLGFAIVLWKGIGWVRAGSLSVGELVSFHFFLAQMVWPMIAIGWVINLLERGRASMRRIEAILDADSEVVESPGAQDWSPIRGEIEFRNLSFSYGEEPVLTDISMTVAEGSLLAIVGETGSGKSTLLQLLSRGFNARPGTLLLDGHDILEWRLSALRGGVAVVPQESFLFSDTVRANILWGDPSASEPDVHAVADIAGLGPDLERLPNGMDTEIGERGVTLSGGQRQRVALARALLRDAPILLLDDCLSAVDTETESRILTGLRRHFRGRTVIMVSHRATAAQMADAVAVLDLGRLVEYGTPDELLALGGLYADLYRRQQIEQELAAV